MANPGMVQWRLLCRQRITPPEGYVVAVDTHDDFDHTELPRIMARVEAASGLAEALRALTEVIEALTTILLPLVREKKALDKWL